MKAIVTAILLTAALVSSLCAAPVLAQTTATATTLDGHKGFDFLIGTWSTHYKRLRHPLSKNHYWYECAGTSVVRPFWNDSANIETGDIRCPQQYISSLTLRLYDDASHQWSLYWGTKKVGLASGAQVGHFDATGVGDFLAKDTFAGKPVIVRYRWKVLAGDRPHFEQAFSADDGRTWETNWISDYTRASASIKARQRSS